MAKRAGRGVGSIEVLRAILIAVTTTGVATGIGLAVSLGSRPGSGALFVLFVAAASYAGGLGAGLLAAALSIVPFQYFFVPPKDSFALGARDVIAVLAFVAAALFVSLVLSRERRTRTRAEVRLSEQERLGEALEETATGSWEWDIEANQVHWSPNLGPLHGLGRGEQPETYEEYLELIHPDDRGRIAAAVEGAVTEGLGYEIEVRTFKPDGEVRWILAQASVISSEDGRPQRVVGLTRDVTARKLQEERQRYLAEATERLFSSLDYERMLGEVARLALPTLADWCSVDLVAEDGAIVNVAVAHTDQEKVRLVRELQQRFPTPPDSPVGIPQVIRTGRSELYREITSDLLELGAQSEEHLEIIRGLGLYSAMIVPLAARGRVLGTISFITSETPRRYHDEDLALAEELARRAAIAVDNATLHRQADRDRDLAELLAEGTKALLSTLDPEQAVLRLLELAVPRLADFAGVYILEDGTLTRLASVLADPGKQRLLGKLRDSYLVGEDEPAIFVRAVEQTEPLIVESLAAQDLTHAGDERDLRVFEELGLRSAMLIPLHALPGVLGVIILSSTRERQYKERDLGMAREFADRAALALGNARLYTGERRARRELRRLQDMTAALSAGVTVEDVADAVITHGIPALEARTGIFVVVDGDEVEVLRSIGYGDVFPERLPLDAPWPVTRAIRRQQIVELQDLEQRRRSYGVPDEIWAKSGKGALIAVPLIIRGRAQGALGFTRDRPGKLAPRERAFVRSLAEQASQALDRAGLYEAERQSREELRRLQDVTAALAAAAEVKEVTDAVLDKGMAALGARAGVLYQALPSGELELLGSRGYDSVADVLRRLPPDSPFAAGEAARTGELVVLESLEARRAAYDVPEPIRQATGEGAVVGVPLALGRHLVGAFGFSLDEARGLTEAERSFLDSLSRQAAQALERAQLYEREQDARRQAELANQTLRALQGVAEIGLAAHSLDELLDTLLVFLRDALGGDRATLLLHDEEQGVFVVRAGVGLDEDVRERVRVPWGKGIAGRIAASGRPLIVDDVRAANPVSEYLGERGGSLVGVPLRLGRRTLGVLHVSSDQRFRFAQAHLALLELAADRVALSIERTALFEREHEIAVTLQRSILPDELPAKRGVDLAARYVPGASGLEVGGDWYDVFELEDGSLALAVGDVVGKGLASAATMAQLRHALRVYALEGLKPASVLARLNRLVDSTGPSFATLFFATLDLDKLVCRYGSAGHPPAVLVRADEPPVLLEGGRSVPIGVHGDPSYRQETVQLQPGDLLLLYTDGLVERRDGSFEEGLDRLLGIAAEEAHHPQALLDRLLEELAGDAPGDDVALLAFRLLPQHPERLELRLSAEPSSLAPLREQLRAWMATSGAAAEDVHEIVLACSEACANAIEHPLRPDRAEFEVAAGVDGGMISIVVRDFGGWSEPMEPSDRGLGLHLMRATMDEVEVVPGENGTEVHLRRALRGRRAVEPPESPEASITALPLPTPPGPDGLDA